MIGYRNQLSKMVFHYNVTLALKNLCHFLVVAQKNVIDHIELRIWISMKCFLDVDRSTRSFVGCLIW